MRSIRSFAKSVVLAVCFIPGAAAPLVANQFAGPAWSRDGIHLALLTATRDAESIFSEAWLFGSPAETSASADHPRSQLWVWNVQTDQFRLLEQSDGWLSRPCWSPDGASIYVIALHPRDGAASPAADELAGTLQLLRKFPDGRAEVLHTENGNFPLADIHRWTSQQPACADNGLHLAVPWLGPPRTLILGVANHQLEGQITEAGHPAWLPRGKQLYYHRHRDPAGTFAAPFGEWDKGQLSAPNTDGDQPIVWNRGASAFFTTRRTSNHSGTIPRHDPLEPHRLELVRISQADNNERVLERLTLGTEEDPHKALAYLALDEANEMLYVCVLQDSAAGIYETIGTETFERRLWHPFGDELSEHRIPVGAPSVSVGGRFLAFQYGMREWCAPTGIMDLQKNQLVIHYPNESAKMRSLWAIAEAVRRLVRKVPTDAAGPFERQPSAVGRNAAAHPLDLFDRPKDQASRDADQKRDISRLTTLGLSLLEEIPAISDDIPQLQQQRSALKLFFHYVREEYSQALGAAIAYSDSLDPDAPGPGALAIAAVQAQCYLALGDTRRARVMLPALIKERQQQLAASDGSFERDELRRLGINLGAVSPAETHDPFLERLRNLLDQ